MLSGSASALFRGLLTHLFLWKQASPCCFEELLRETLSMNVGQGDSIWIWWWPLTLDLGQAFPCTALLHRTSQVRAGLDLCSPHFSGRWQNLRRNCRNPQSIRQKRSRTAVAVSRLQLLFQLSETVDYHMQARFDRYLHQIWHIFRLLTTQQIWIALNRELDPSVDISSQLGSASECSVFR